MFNKVYTEIDVFTSNIKDADGHDKMLNYASSNIYASLKLLMFASKTFSIYARVLIFFVISTAGLLMLSAIGAMLISLGTLLLIFSILFILTLVYFIHFRKALIFRIQESKKLKY